MKSTVEKLKIGQKFRIKLPVGWTAWYTFVEAKESWIEGSVDLGCQTPVRVRWYTGVLKSQEVEVED